MSTEGRRTALSLPMFEYAGGRCIYRDGKPFVTIGRPVDPKTGAGPDAVDVDAFARAVPVAFAALAGILEHCALIHNKWGEGCNRKEADEAAELGRRALALLDWRRS